MAVPPELAVDAAAGAAAAAAAGAAAGAALPEDADLFTPPCPLQAPRPPFEVEPSLQVTVVPEPVDEPEVALVVDAAAGAAAAGAAAGAVLPDDADLFTPP